MRLLQLHEIGSGRVCRSLHIEASGDGKTVVLVDSDTRKTGIQREYRFEIATGELIALIRAHGCERPGKNQVRPSFRTG